MPRGCRATHRSRRGSRPSTARSASLEFPLRRESIKARLGSDLVALRRGCASHPLRRAGHPARHVRRPGSTGGRPPGPAVDPRAFVLALRKEAGTGLPASEIGENFCDVLVDPGQFGAGIRKVALSVLHIPIGVSDTTGSVVDPAQAVSLVLGVKPFVTEGQRVPAGRRSDPAASRRSRVPRR